MAKPIALAMARIWTPSLVTLNARARPPLAFAPRTGNRVWGHRHEPSLRRPGVLLRIACGCAHAGEHFRRSLADLLVARRRRDAQVPHLRDPLRQPRRGWHSRAHG